MEISKNDSDVSTLKEMSQVDDTISSSDPPMVEPIISLHSIIVISSLQTLNIISDINHQKPILLIYIGSNHNFIHRRISQETLYYIHAIHKFQIIIVNGSSMKYEGHSENVHQDMGDCNMKSHMFSIEMGGCDIILGVKWLHTPGPITMDLKELYMKFQ